MPILMKRVLTFAGVVVLVAAATLVIALVRMQNAPATLEFSVLDAESRGWVWDMTARLDDRFLRGYYQSDAGPIRFRFTRLARGDGTLEITAPHYETARILVHLRSGVNLLQSPVLMRGLEIPGLDHFLAFETPKGTDIQAQLRPVGADGKAILNHPCLPLWVGCTISTEVKDGAPAAEATDIGASRGKELFQGQVPWRWDPTPETQFRYTALIPGSAIVDDPSPLRVIDYLIVVPDPLKLSREELASLMESIWNLPGMDARRAALEKEKARLRYFTDTSWNVKARSS
jgi:hypothetical protein